MSGSGRTLAPGEIEVDDASGPVRVRFALPQEWFTLRELRRLAAFLVDVADYNEPSAEVDELVQVLERASILPLQGSRHIARSIIAAGFHLGGNRGKEETG